MTSIAFSNSLAGETRSMLTRDVCAVMKEKLMLDVASPCEDLLASGVLDSLALVQLLAEIEERFGIVFSIAELDIEDIRSVDAIVNFIVSRRFANVTGS